MAAAVGSWVRADWRRRWWHLLALTLVAGAVAGGVLGAAAGARRTASSLDRLAAQSRSADALVAVSEGGIELAREVDGLPSVAESSAVTLVFAMLEGVDVDIGLFLPRDEVLGAQLERDVLLRGRRADPTRADEVTINEPTARLAGVDVGDRLEIHTLSPEQVAAEQYFPARGPVVTAMVAGVTRGPADLSSRPEGNITGTVALHPEITGDVDEFATYVAVRLRTGASVADLERDLAGFGIPSLDLIAFDAFTRPAQRTISTLAVGLAVLALVAGFAAVVVVGQAVGRHVAGAVRDDATLRALGMVRRQRVGAMAATALPAVVFGPVVAAAVAVAISPLTPIGLARRAEPDPGVRLDVAVLLAGVLGTAVVVAAAAVIGAVSATGRPRLQSLPRPSAAASAAARLGGSPSMVHGVALALDRRANGRSVRSTVVALAATALVATGAVTFSASLARLADSPYRWGAPWDLALDFTSSDVDAAAEQLRDDDHLASVATWDAGAALVDGEPVRAFAAGPLRGEFAFSLVEGQQPRPGEVVVGADTAAQGGFDIGDDVVVSAPDGRDEGESLRVVGIAVFPEVDDGDFSDAVGLTAPDFEAHASVPDLFEASQLVVTIDDAAPVAATEERLGREYETVPVVPTRPGIVTNLAGVLPIPRVLLVFAALLGLAALAHALQSTADSEAGGFATLRAIGMTRRQRWGCSLVQSVVLAVVAVAIGVPLGVLAGRTAWRSVAGSIDVAPDALVPAAALTVIVVGALAGAALSAALVRAGVRVVVPGADRR